MTTDRRSRAVLAIGAAALIALSACTPEEGTAMDYEHAFAELSDLVEAIQGEVSGAWQPQDSGAVACALPDGSTGARAGFSRVGPGVPDDEHDRVVEWVVAALTDAGFAPTVTEAPPVNGIAITRVRYPELDAAVPGEPVIAVSVGPAATTILAQTRCGVGDAREINREWQENG